MGPQLVPVLGIAYIAAAIREAGHEVDIVDMCGEAIDRSEMVNGKYVQYGMTPATLKTRIQFADAIGFACMFSQDWPFHRGLIQYVRELFPEAVLFAGGEHITALPEFCLEDCPSLDLCVLGEGDGAIVDLIHMLDKEGSLSEAPSLVYRDKNGGYARTKRAERIGNIDALSWPAWDLIPMENYLSRGLTYHLKRGRTIPMLATRGCPYHCSFCSNENMWGRRWLPRDPKSVVDEMEHYIKIYKAENFVFSDLTAVISRESIVSLCQEILRRKLRITWQLPTLRTESLDAEVLRVMYAAGCRELDFALESGSTDVLKSVDKRNDPKKICSLIKDGLKLGMNLSTNIVIGLPQERFRDFLKTYGLMMKLAVAGLQELNVFPFVPYPGSRLFKEFLEQKKIKLGDEYFMKLFGYADLSKAVSWSAHFGPRTLSGMRFGLLSSFYSLMLISHPLRMLQLFINPARGRVNTKLEGVLQRVFRNIQITFRKSSRIKLHQDI
ncbi:MAG: hypothetical protein A2Y04_00360 [Omnitrophica WOR_2 bacterium GWC2_45_7]|nr:MAG: hypothetical protein A2Y04_00360 [Omnitrophica WOR_2 bacterium GWC2_45_7]